MAEASAVPYRGGESFPCAVVVPWTLQPTAGVLRPWSPPAHDIAALCVLTLPAVSRGA